MRRRAPPLLRLSRLLGWLGLIVLILLVVFVATAVYSATQLRPQNPNGNQGSSVTLASNGSVRLSFGLNLTNSGYYSVDALSLAIQVRYPNGTLAGLGGSPSVAIPPGSTGRVPVSVWIPLQGESEALLTQDQQMTTRIWANVTYATLFGLHLSIPTNYSWGAPFAQFNATPGAPTPQPNGTALVPVSVSFQNHASFPDTGSLRVDVKSASGVTCSSSSVGIDVPSHESFDRQINFFAQPSCNPSGGQIVATYTGNGLTVSLPPEAIP